MPDGTDFVMRPVMAGLCRYESLNDGTLTLCDIAALNDALDVRDDNEFLAAQEQQRKQEVDKDVVPQWMRR